MVTLQKELPSPFLPQPEAVNSKKDTNNKKTPTIKIDLDGIEKRVMSFPVTPDRYTSINSYGDKVYWTKEPVEGALNFNFFSFEPDAKSTLEVYDYATQEKEAYAEKISSFQFSRDRQWMALRMGNRLKVLKSNEKLKDKKSSTGRNSGSIDLNRVKVLIEPANEWKQMLLEAWRLQRDHFWHKNMGKLDWDEILHRYEPLLDKINTRREYSDLAWELQGELGTSHCYEFGGDYREKPQYPVGFLGADYSWDKRKKAYRIDKILAGDSWDVNASSPLSQTGVNCNVGDWLLEINGQTLTEYFSPYEALFHLAGSEVQLKILHRNVKNPKVHVVKTLKQETLLRYRDWVNTNAEYVKKKTKGKVGYIHIPNMGAQGFAEFHRHYLQTYDSDALIVDVRYNGGGHVSQLLLEKLTRQRNGVCESRWFGELSVPDESPAGPIVALTNEYAGSDGDIFSHTFKMKNLGPLIGKRTWGGVVGIWPRHTLADGSITTQPEFSHWYEDVGWDVENYGTDPDIDVDIAPHDYKNGKDPQMDRAISEVLKLVKKQPPYRPKLDKRPDLRPMDI